MKQVVILWKQTAILDPRELSPLFWAAMRAVDSGLRGLGASEDPSPHSPLPPPYRPHLVLRQPASKQRV